MEWLSVKKYKPAASLQDNLVVRALFESGYAAVLCVHYEDNIWVDVDHREPIEVDGCVVTHFLILPSLEIAE